MSKAFMCSLYHKGILGGGLYLISRDFVSGMGSIVKAISKICDLKEFLSLRKILDMKRIGRFHERVL